MQRSPVGETFSEQIQESKQRGQLRYLGSKFVPNPELENETTVRGKTPMIVRRGFSWNGRNVRGFLECYALSRDEYSRGEAKGCEV
jgi:hypothetical protein